MKQAGLHAGLPQQDSCLCAAPAAGKRQLFLLSAGETRKKLYWDAPGALLELCGAGQEKTTLLWADGAGACLPGGQRRGTFRSYTAFLGGKAVYVHDLAIVNAAGPGDTAGQAVAAYVDAPFARFERVRFSSRQDTLFCAPLPETEREPGGFRGPRETAPRCASLQYYKDCTIEGDIDFIFGGADAVFENCEIRSLNLGRLLGQNGFALAPSTKPGGLGFVFLNCRFTTDSAPYGTVYLGRPWRPSGRAALLRCSIGAHIAPAGWSAWAPQAQPNEPDAFLAEYGCTGPGAATEGRAAFAKQLCEAEAEELLHRARTVCGTVTNQTDFTAAF